MRWWTCPRTLILCAFSRAHHTVSGATARVQPRGVRGLSRPWALTARLNALRGERPWRREPASKCGRSGALPDGCKKPSSVLNG